MPHPDASRPSTDMRPVFGRHARLRTHRDLRHVRENGRSRAGRLCVTAFSEALDEHRRVAFVISRRYSPKAVERNRARRLFREAYRQLLPELRPAWIVLIPRYRMKGAKMDDVREEMRSLFIGFGLIASST